MKIIKKVNSQATQDGDGVKISRIADFSDKYFDPYLMIDELKSDDQNDFIGGFPAHPHRGIETFTYMIKGGFEHKDQLGNQAQITAGNVQWMSTGYGVIHSEMPITDEEQGMHGFQIWLNMPAKDKLRPARYQDSISLPQLNNQTGASLRLLAGEWVLGGCIDASPLADLAGDGALADLTLQSAGHIELNLFHKEQVLVYVHTGSFASPSLDTGELAIVDSQQLLDITAGENGAGALILTGNKINEKIVHMGPFVMNTEQEIQQAISDYQQGKFGSLS
ncbi:pirin family protein [Psychromonas algicola]|uniref:pirin family protein n=1 Tax=Psychromonas algicola TaxID=2555642 RepID=UPI001067CED0|nr:pirin family protein [Psychromonas sp. RZ5]TEW44761.1 pirin family protein [Psychromonas sp. RZ5]